MTEGVDIAKDFPMALRFKLTTLGTFCIIFLAIFQRLHMTFYSDFGQMFNVNNWNLNILWDTMAIQYFIRYAQKIFQVIYV